MLRTGAERLAIPRQPVRHQVVTHVLGTFCYRCLRAGQSNFGGAGGIRTLDRALQPYNGLANRRLQPLGHSSIRRICPTQGRAASGRFEAAEFSEGFDAASRQLGACDQKWRLKLQSERGGSLALFFGPVCLGLDGMTAARLGVTQAASSCSRVKHVRLISAIASRRQAQTPFRLAVTFATDRDCELR
jgi:hypothetical protein